MQNELLCLREPGVIPTSTSSGGDDTCGGPGAEGEGGFLIGSPRLYHAVTPHGDQITTRPPACLRCSTACLTHGFLPWRESSWKGWVIGGYTFLATIATLKNEM